MNILILYASIEGQTEKIARFVGARVKAAGHTPVPVDIGAKGATADIAAADRIILAGSVHRRRHPQEFEKFLTAQATALATRPTLLLSVSLCAAFAEGQAEAASYVADMTERTGLAPTETVLVAGALQYDKLKDYEAQVVRFVALDLNKYDEVEGDHEFTDWDTLGRSIAAYLAG